MTDQSTSLQGFETIAGPDLRDGGLQMHGRCLKGRHGFQPVRCICAVHALHPTVSAWRNPDTNRQRQWPKPQSLVPNPVDQIRSDPEPEDRDH